MVIVLACGLRKVSKGKSIQKTDWPGSSPSQIEFSVGCIYSGLKSSNHAGDDPYQSTKLQLMAKISGFHCGTYVEDVQVYAC
jgi:hypothetical protein